RTDSRLRPARGCRSTPGRGRWRAPGAGTVRPTAGPGTRCASGVGGVLRLGVLALFQTLLELVLRRTQGSGDLGDLGAPEQHGEDDHDDDDPVHAEDL